MKFKLFSILLFIFVPALFVAQEIHLKDVMASAEPGGYVVTEQNKTFTFLHIHEKTSDTLIIEEVTIPGAKKPMSWRNWFESGAPGHTSWTMSQINLQTGRIEETFSFTHQGWLDLADSTSFLTTLLNLSFQSVPENQRRRIGLAPGYGKPDRRPIWNPRLIVEGQPVAHAQFSAWKARWPGDGSDLSRKKIEIYLPQLVSGNSPSFPVYFPYWLEVEGKIGSAKVRIVDSGTNVSSPKGDLPLRPISLIKEGELQTEGLVFYLNAPSYYRDFLILAEETMGFGKTFSLSFETFFLDKKVVALRIPKSTLTELAYEETYRFLIAPKENPSLYVETKPFSFPSC